MHLEEANWVLVVSNNVFYKAMTRTEKVHSRLMELI